MQEVVIDALAGARLARLIRVDGIMRPARERVLAFAYQASGRTKHPSYDSWQDQATLDHHPPKLVELLECPWCLTMWTVAACRVARRVAPRAWPPLAEALAAAYVAGSIDAHQ